MGTSNSAISVRFSEDRHAEISRLASLLGVSEGQFLKMCFEDISTMLRQAGEEKLPMVVHMVRAAEEYHASQPSLALKKLDKTLVAKYDDGTYRMGAEVMNEPKKAKKK